MKIDILTHGPPEPFLRGESHIYGGAVAYAAHLATALRGVKCDVEFVLADNPPRKDADVIVLGSMGLNQERTEAGEKKAIQRMYHLKRVAPNVPIFVCVHGTVDFRFFRHTRHLVQALPYAGVLLMGDSKAIHTACDQWMRDVPRHVFPLPYEFMPEYLTDRSDYADTIISPARISSFKGTDKVLDLAQQLPEYNWLVRGDKTGMFWGHNLKDHPWVEGKNVKWIGDPKQRMDAYADAAFGIDLTLLWYKSQLEGERVQYSTLEGVNCGVIPVTWDCWQAQSWEGPYLPSPYKISGKIHWDVPACVEIIKGISYSYDVAKQNYETLAPVHSYEATAKRYMGLFEKTVHEFRNKKRKRIARVRLPARGLL